MHQQMVQRLTSASALRPLKSAQVAVFGDTRVRLFLPLLRTHMQAAAGSAPCSTSGRCGGGCQVWAATMAASEAPTAARARASLAAAPRRPSSSSMTACWVAICLASAMDVSWDAADVLGSAACRLISSVEHVRACACPGSC